jgi:hypothetical protein
MIKKLLLTIILVLFLFTSSFGDVIGRSKYDGIYDIFIAQCNGVTKVYRNCVITNDGEYSISFIPDQGRIQTGNGKQIFVTKDCATVTLIEK